MDSILTNIKISVNKKLFNKDPESSELGKKILSNSIELINDLGFDSFTFKKLGERIGSNESSVYRYFDNKHKLLIYLTSWYWGWMEYRLLLATVSISDPKHKLRTALNIISDDIVEDNGFEHINECYLQQIIINESSKSYLTKEVDAENKEGYFLVYKRVVRRISEMIKEVNPNYIYPASLASTAVESVLHQNFLRNHFLSITDCNKTTHPRDFVIDLVFNNLNK
ncbi:TetR/AcrR family transcriptional regulator [Paucihalobacter ruber]|uniref:TetR/AcrR family transcriptional regulator n=1 Tax=Paucihalobacter ruber TaxID=2567861 RepID=A0A506PIS5_9FLAO|nr:TetR/AcrR family transcriptional regulator [Paucihalobacter ruber]TPV33438.1 TetR/AcrR family transcriptional regulator [Paucihalobacter ruber]